MQKELKQKLICSIINILIFVIIYLISKMYFSKLYLFEWTARHMYMGVWIVTIVLIKYNRIKLSFSVTIGNVLGILIGQYFGDWIRNKNMLRITEDTSPEISYRLQHHPGVEIWIMTLLFIGIGSMLFKFVKNIIVKQK